MLEILTGSGGYTVAEIAREMELTQAHIWKILAGLESAGYITREPGTGRYVLTSKLIALARRHTDTAPFLRMCQSHLDYLAEKTGELVQLALLEGNVLRFVAKAEGIHRLTVRSLLGRPVDLHATASGKAWLATLPEKDAIAIARRAGLRRFTPSTQTAPSQLRPALRAARRAGYAIVEEEHLEGANAIAAPLVPPFTGDVAVGAVAVTGPSFRLPRRTLTKLAPTVLDVAHSLAQIWTADDALTAHPVSTRGAHDVA